MEQSIFKALIDQYQTPHPMLGVDGQAFPMIPYSMKLELIQNAGASQGLTMDGLINAETRRVKQLLDAAYANGDAQLATRVLNELYPLMVEDIQSGNQTAVQVYSPVVNQIQAIMGAMQQPQPVAQEMAPEPQPSIAEGEAIVDVEPVGAAPVDAAPEAPLDGDDRPVDAQPVEAAPEIAQSAEAAPANAQPVEAAPANAEADEAEPKGVPAGKRPKKRTPASAIVLFILGGAFLLAFLLINALPFIGIGTYEELNLMGLLDIAIGCLVLALVCIVIGIIIVWRSKAKR